MTTLCFVCFDFNESNTRLQPWRYIFEVMSGLNNNGFEIHVITDGYPKLQKDEDSNGIHIHRVASIGHKILLKNPKLVSLFEGINPDLIFWTICPTSWMYLATIRALKKPLIGLWLGTTYTITQLLNLGGTEICRNFSHISLHFLSSVTPGFLTAYLLQDPLLKKIIVLNESNRRNILRYGFPSQDITVIPPGLDKNDLLFPKNVDIDDVVVKWGVDKKKYILLYFGSPVTIRGTDTIVRALTTLKRSIPNIQLLVLSRRKSEELFPEERYLEKIIVENGIKNDVKIISGFLNHDDVKRFITLSDVIVLPFKFVQADTPLSILEAMALQKVVISTRVDGIPDLLSDRRGILIEPNNDNALAEAIQNVYQNDELRKEIEMNARNYCLTHIDWEQVTGEFIPIITDVIK
ncbi:MAG: glycosyltransferase family 4 protein [Methanoregula sp.]